MALYLGKLLETFMRMQSEFEIEGLQAKMSPIKAQLGVRIANIRQDCGYSQRVFSSMIGLDRVTLNRIERGEGNPTLETLIRIAEGLDVEVTALFE